MTDSSNGNGPADSGIPPVPLVTPLSPGAAAPIPPVPLGPPAAPVPPSAPTPPDATPAPVPTPAEPTGTAYAQPDAPMPGAAVPGRTLGIVALILAFFFQLLGLILGIVALVQSRKAGVKNAPAVWAIALSIVFGVIGTIILIVVIAQTASFLAQCQGLDPGVYDLDNGGTITCS